MLKEFASPLILEFHTSTVFQLYLSGVHALAIVAVIFSSLSLVISMLIISMISLSFLYQKKYQNKVKKMVWLSGKEMALHYQYDEAVSAQLSTLSFSIAWLVILVLRTERDKLVSVLIPFDSLDAESFRLLKVRLTIISYKELVSRAEDE